jgi:hypothetical protein
MNNTAKREIKKKRTHDVSIPGSALPTGVAGIDIQ